MGKKILLIEENNALRKNTAEILELADYEVSTAINGKVGIEKAINWKPDLVVSDISMSVLDGYGVLQILRKDKKLSKTPFIFMSSKSDHSEVRKGMDLGASDYLTIPCDESELLSAIEARLKVMEPFDKGNDVLSIFEDNKNINLGNLDRLFLRKKKYKFKKGWFIYCEGNNSNHLFYLLDGKVKSFKNNEYGKELIISIFKGKNLFGITSLTENNSYRENTLALEDSTVIKITKREFLKLVEGNSELSIQLFNLLIDKLENLESHLIHLIYDPVRKKIAKILYELYEENASNVIEISRSDLANMVGIAKETLIRTLSELREEKIIKTKRRTIKIIDIEKLKLVQ